MRPSKLLIVGAANRDAIWARQGIDQPPMGKFRPVYSIHHKNGYLDVNQVSNQGIGSLILDEMDEALG